MPRLALPSVMLLFAACTPSAGIEPDSLGTSQAIKIGSEYLPIPDGAVGVSLIEVANDSRCPARVLCARAGSADVVFGIRVGMGPTVRTTLRAGDQEPRTAVAGGLVMALDSLTPYPAMSANAIRQSQYTAWVTFRTAPN